MNRINLLIEKFWASQLAKPEGWFGKWFMANRLNLLNQCMNDLTFKELQLHENEHVLEIGFGGGALLKQALDFSSSVRVTGLDASAPMIESASKRFFTEINQNRLSLKLCNADQGIPYEDATFDKICTVNTIYFWKSPQHVLKECHRILKSGGSLIICFNPKEELEKWSGHRHGFLLYTLNEVLALVRAAGFRDESYSEESDPDQGVFYCVKAFK